jgi:glycosyltransferase involved in cell wall biosynthesis
VDKCKNFLALLLPTYNRLLYLKELILTLESQTDKDFLLIISNNGSTDGTKEWLDNWRTNTNLNVYINHNKRNFGPLFNAEILIALAKKYGAEWLTIICDDDLVENDFVKVFKAKLKTTKASLVVCNYKVINENGHEIGASQNRNLFLTPAENMLNFFEGNIRVDVAGISGFCFKSCNFMGLAKFPKGYHDDSWLVAEQACFLGIELLDEYLYARRLWSGAESGKVYSSVSEFFKISYADFLFRRKLILLCERLISINHDIPMDVATKIRDLVLEHKKKNFATNLFKHKINKLINLIADRIWKR